MKKVFCGYLIARRKRHLDTTAICAAAREEGVEMYNTPTPETLKIVQQLQEDVKKHYQDHKTKRDVYLLSKANFEFYQHRKSIGYRYSCLGRQWKSTK